MTSLPAPATGSVAPMSRLRPCAPVPAPATGTVVTTGPTFCWPPAGGQLTPTTSWTAVLEVTAAPALGGPGTEDEAAATRTLRGAAASLVLAARTQPGCDAVELRWVKDDGEDRLHLYLAARSTRGATTALGALAALRGHLPAGFATGPAPARALGPRGGSYLDLRRTEVGGRPTWPGPDGPDVLWHLADRPGDASAWNRVARALLGVREGAVSVLVQVAELTPGERALLDAYRAGLENLGAEHDDVDVLRRLVRVPGDVAARDAALSWAELREELDRPVLARIGLRGPAGDLARLAPQVGAAVAGRRRGVAPHMRVAAPTSEEELRAAAYSFDHLSVIPWGPGPLWSRGLLPAGLARLPFLYGVTDLAGRLLMPLPTQAGCPGLPQSDASQAYRGPVVEQDGDRIHLGRVHGSAGAMGLPARDLTEHTLVVGSSGRGKTTAIQSLLVRLWRRERVPFLVIEPVRNEYRALKSVLGEDVTVLTACREDLVPLRTNLLTVPEGVRLNQHLAAVKQALLLSAPMPSPLDVLLEESLARAYRHHGWQAGRRGVRTPGVGDVLAGFRQIVSERHYTGEALNMLGAMETRLRRLGGDGDLARTLAAGQDTLTPRLGGPLVIELHELVEHDDVRLVTAVVLQQVRATARARGVRRGLAHLTVLEEAHLFLDAGDRHGGAQTGERLRSEAVRALSTDIATLRGYGEGFVLATQSPGELAPQARSSTANRVVMGLMNDDDRRAALADLGLSGEAERVAAGLGRGLAFVRVAGSGVVPLVDLEPAPGVDTGRTLDDDALRRLQRG